MHTRHSSMLLTRVVRMTTAGVAVTAFSLIVVSFAAAQAKPSAAAKAAGPDIMLMQPTALKTGDNRFEVMVKGADGKPVTNADVSLLFVMPKTPKMPEMRNEVKLKPTGNGMYEGPGTVLMAGAWNVTVSVKQAGKEIGQKKITLTAK